MDEQRTERAAIHAPIFSILAGVFVVICFGTPLIMLTVPLMATAAMAIIAMVRKERPRWIAPVALALCVVIFFAAGSQMSSIRGDGAANLSAVKIADWSWDKDPDFAGKGTVKWRVAVKNVSDRAISNVEIGFSSYDKVGKLLASTSAFVDAIPPGETRTDESYADLYGTEERADVAVESVRFSGD